MSRYPLAVPRPAPDMQRLDRAVPDPDFLVRVLLRRAEEDVAKAVLRGRRERDRGQIRGPQQLVLLTAPRRKCLGCRERWEHTRGYCVYCYQKVRFGRPLDDVDDEPEEEIT